MKNMKKRMVAFLMMFVMICSICIVSGNGSIANAAGGQSGEIRLVGKAHVQTYADQNGKIVNQNGIETLVLGTRGQAKRVESITIQLQNGTQYTGGLQYRVHRQTYGWTDWIDAGNPAGTQGQGKRLEAIEMRLTGELQEHYNIRYRVHIQTYGDGQGWMYNGGLAGTTGEAKRLEEVQVQILPKATYNPDDTTNEIIPTVSYRVHRQTYGWETNWKRNGDTSGTVGQGKRLEGITISVDDQYASNSGIRYRTYVQSYGWLDWVQNGEMAGTQGQAKRLEAIQIELTGDLSERYDVYYRVHAQTFGWLKWAKNGEESGSLQLSKRLEAIQIKLVRKGAAAPSDADVGNPQYAVYYPENYYWWIEDQLRDRQYSGQGNDIVRYAEQFIGTPYVWGGSDLRNGVDCSGFTMKVFEPFGYRLGHLVSLQYKAGREISILEAQPGDLFIYKTRDKKDFYHVEIYYGQAKVIGAPGGSVGIRDMFMMGMPDYVVRIIK